MNKFNLWSALAIFAWLVALLYITTIYAKSEDDVVVEVKEPIVVEYIDPVYNKPAQEPVTYEDWFKANAEVIDDCTITHYCVEKYEHICGEGHGICFTGVPVTAGWTCAVDSSVIPYGSEVMVDYGDRVEFYKAQDKGGWIKGNHIDLAVETHELADQLGTLTATVYFMEVEREFEG